MTFTPSPALPRVRRVGSFHELATTPFAGAVNALCWPRALPGDFAEVVRRLGPGEDIVPLDDADLLDLPVTAAGRVAIRVMLDDLHLLRRRQLDPALNCIHGYPRDEAPGPVPTDVFSFHADSAPVAADTWLCTYHGAPSEGLLNEDARRCIDIPETRAALLARFGSSDDDAFSTALAENCYDLHYVPTPGAQPYSFGVGHLWRIAVEYPDSPVPPCIHRAPDPPPGSPPRLLLIS
jgi:hypothetical protein